MKGLGTILAIIGIIVAIIGVANHFVALFAKGQAHTSLYIAVVGAVIFVIGLILLMMGRRTAAA